MTTERHFLQEQLDALRKRINRIDADAEQSKNSSLVGKSFMIEENDMTRYYHVKSVYGFRIECLYYSCEPYSGITIHTLTLQGQNFIGMKRITNKRFIKEYKKNLAAAAALVKGIS